METLQRNKLTLFFFLALLFHLSLLMSFFMFGINPQPNAVNKISLKSLPAYIYREEKYTPPSQRQLPADKPEEEKLVSKSGIEKPIPKKVKVPQATSQTLSLGKGRENVNLQLKSKNKVDKPLLNLLTKAVAAHLVYPKIAVDFHLSGKALVGFVLYPDGHLTDVSIVESSGAQLLDEAALAAINGIVPVRDVNFYISKPTPLLMGIIFQ